jgi:hypothetical protein
LSETEPIRSRPRPAGPSSNLVTFSRPAAAADPWLGGSPAKTPDAQRSRPVTAFDRHELSEILAVYGRKVAAGEWRDYAIDMSTDTASFSVFRRASECPLFRIEKTPKDARKQGAYRVVAASGLILKRGKDLVRVLGILEPARLVD